MLDQNFGAGVAIDLTAQRDFDNPWGLPDHTRIPVLERQSSRSYDFGSLVYGVHANQGHRARLLCPAVNPRFPNGAICQVPLEEICVLGG